MKASVHNRRDDNFWSFCFKKAQMVDWAVVAAVCIFSYVLIRICYPYPATISDSFSYIRSSIEDRFMIFRPFGYSAFLQFAHLFSQSIHSIFIIQTLLYLFASGLFVLAMKKYFPVSRSWLRIALEIAVVCSPVALYMLNAIMSDALFCIAIYLMLAMLIVVIMENSIAAVIVFLSAFFVSLFTRYSAMFFPVVFIPIVLFHRSGITKWILIGGICVIFGFFYDNVSDNMEESIGYRQFSTGFDGWQLANNAMCMLPYIDMDDRAPKVGKVKELHEFSKHRFDDAITQATGNGTRTTAGFLWNNDFPLKQYLYYSMERTGKSYPVLWARLGATTYSDYGKWLILNYPGKFLKYYLSPNIRQAFYPTSLEVVNYSAVTSGNRELKEWFHYDGPMEARYPVYSKALGAWLPIVELATWLIMVIVLIFLICFWPRWNMSREQSIVFWLIFVFGFLYYGSTVFASPVAIRYWMPMQAVKIALIWSLVPQIRQVLNYVRSSKQVVCR